MVHLGATRQELEQTRFYRSPRTNRLEWGKGFPRGLVRKATEDVEIQPPLGPTGILLLLTGCKPHLTVYLILVEELALEVGERNKQKWCLQAT